METPKLTIQEIALIKALPEDFITKTYSHKPHLQDLPYDLRVQDPKLLQERIDACDDKIKESTALIKELETKNKEKQEYDKDNYEKCDIDTIINGCMEFIDGKYSHEKLIQDIAKQEGLSYETIYKEIKPYLNSRAYEVLKNCTQSIHPDLQAQGLNNPISLEHIDDWYGNGGFPRHSELNNINGMLSKFDFDGAGGQGKVNLIPYTRDLRKLSQKHNSPLCAEARQFGHAISQKSGTANSILQRASTEYKDVPKQLEAEKLKLEDYKIEKQRATEKRDQSLKQ